ncbi:group III truncated hemoglobin [uncultured Bartonella sp.]|uniref:group III truncated hemoglobin n=1 Tax=uncultured Bartonella sp. TaxID=104108 RepID=UPI00262CC4F5|nr:group III truncated hemoglobin [uncultured Bartonella sp.]
MAQKPIAINEAVIETVVRTFYDRVRQDAILGPIFESHIVDWEPHLQNMFAFWSSVMLHTNRYNGRPMPKHVVLPIDATHFQRWLLIFQTTVSELCLEEDASLFMKKARQIAHSLEMGHASKNRTGF